MSIDILDLLRTLQTVLGAEEVSVWYFSRRRFEFRVYWSDGYRALRCVTDDELRPGDNMPSLEDKLIFQFTAMRTASKRMREDHV